MKIAFLFLTIYTLYHENAWQDFFKGHENDYSIYIHSKRPFASQSPFKQYEIKDKIPTTRMHTIKAQQELLKEAIKDTENQRFVFISEVTIPLQNFDVMQQVLMQTSNSIIDYALNPHQDPTDLHYAKKSQSLIPEQCRYKNSQWIVLNRKHATLMAEDTECIDVIAQYEADNELYPAAFLAWQGLLDEVDNKATTYVCWDKESTKVPGKKIPYVFSDLTDPFEYDAIMNAISRGYLFARKFHPQCNLSVIRDKKAATL